jgi:hypothetical protein
MYWKTDRWRWFFRPIRLNDCGSLNRFIGLILVQQFAVKALVAIAVIAIMPDSGTADRSDTLRDPFVAAILLVVVVPIVETLLLQTLPIEFCRALRGNRLSLCLKLSKLLVAVAS